MVSRRKINHRAGKKAKRRERERAECVERGGQWHDDTCWYITGDRYQAMGKRCSAGLIRLSDDRETIERLRDMEGGG